jgi:PAS domain S-box-containing protein
MKNTTLQKHLTNSLRFLILIGILSYIFPRVIDAQTQNIRFKHLTIDNGLSQSWVHSIVQDKYGFMWVGTDDGLNRYDGYNFRVYKNNIRNKYSISSSSIMTLFNDSRGNLWIGTKQGLNLYDRQNDRFVKNPKWPQTEILAIAEDKNNTLWIGTTLDIHHLDVEHDSITVYSANDVLRNKNNLLSSGSCGAIFVDSRNNLWIGTHNGLNLYDKGKKIFIYYYHEDHDPNSIISNDVRSIAEDKAGRLWIGTPDGLDLFTNAQDHPRKGIFVHYQNNSKDQNSISQGTVLSLLQDDKHNLWIGTENGGLDLLNLNTYKKGVNSFVHFKNDPNRETSLSNNSIYSLFQDTQDNIWIGTFGNGINIVNSVRDKFIHIKSELGINNSLNNNLVNAFLEEKNFLWIGTEGGLNRYNKKDNTFKHYVHDPLNKKSIGSNAVWAICKDKRGNLWIGTWGGGLNRFDYKTETFKHYYNDPIDTTSIGSNNIFSVLEDSRGNLWIGTMGGGLNMFDSKKNMFTRYTISNSGIAFNYVQAIIEAKNGDLWFVNSNSIGHFDRTTKRFENFAHSANDSTSLSSNKVISIFGDSKGNLWMGTDAGLNLFNKSTKRFTWYRIEDGLPDNSINSILEDDHGNLWIGTNKGLSKFINAINLPAKPEFKNYIYGDGLQGNGFGRRSCYRGTDGMMYFGGTNGFNVFHPDKITENTYVPPIVISDFQIFNKPELIGDKGLKKDIGNAEDLVLSYTQSVFSFDFAALNYIASSKNQYAYMLEGFDKDWNFVGTKHTATYTNLDPGRYIFRVKGSNNDGVWNEEGISLPIVITPPFWKTWIFRIFSIAAIILSIFVLYRVRTYTIRKRNKELERKIELRTQELADKKNLLQTVIDLVPDSIFAKDKNHKFVLNNRAHMNSLASKSQEELIGKTDEDFFPPNQAKESHKNENLVMETGQPIIDKEEKDVDLITGVENWVLTSKVQFKNNQDELQGIVGIRHLINERKRAEAERERLIAQLQDALADVKLLSGLVPICANCKKIRDDQGYWTQIESYIQDRSDAKFSHSICPDCAAKLYPNYNIKKQ